MNAFVYRRTEAALWTVGHEDEAGKWHPESDWNKAEDAAARAHYLNGGNQQQAPPHLIEAAFEGLICFIAAPKPTQEQRDKALRGLVELRNHYRT